jgi:hypothetical protein
MGASNAQTGCPMQSFHFETERSLPPMNVTHQQCLVISDRTEPAPHIFNLNDSSTPIIELDLATATDATHDPTPSTTMQRLDRPFQFLNLPTELRIEVYKKALVVGKVFYTPDHYDIRNGSRFNDYESYEIPSLSLLRVCKQIHHEAEYEYLSKNLFVLPSSFASLNPFSRNGVVTSRPRGRWLFSKAAFQHLKKVSVSFDSRSEAPLVVAASDWVREVGVNPLWKRYRLFESHKESIRRVQGNIENRYGISLNAGQ